MILKPQDVLVLLKLVAIGGAQWSYNKLAVEIGMSPAEVHGAIKRALSAGLAVRVDDQIRPNIKNLEEFLIHGLKYVYIPDYGELTRGIPTSYAAPPLESHFAASSESPPVWPDPEGNVRGMTFAPLYKAAPSAARNDLKLYELLALVDAIRGGRARERSIAIKELSKRLKQYADTAR